MTRARDCILYETILAIIRILDRKRSKTIDTSVFTVKELARELDTSYYAVAMRLKRLMEKGLVERIARGVYRPTDKLYNLVHGDDVSPEDTSMV